MAIVLPHEATPTFRELFVGLGRDVSALLHDEIDLAKNETRRELRTSLILLGTTAVLGMASALSLAAAAVLALGRFVDPVWAALLVGLALAAVTAGFVFLVRGWRRRTDHRLHAAEIQGLEEKLQ